MQKLRPDEAVGLNAAVQLGKNGGDRHSLEARQDQPDTIRLKGYGTSRAYILARLERDGFTALAERVRGSRGLPRRGAKAQELAQSDNVLPLAPPGRPAKDQEGKGSERTVSRGETAAYPLRRLKRDAVRQRHADAR